MSCTENGGILTYLSCMDTACGYGKTHPQNSCKETRKFPSILGT